MTISMERRILQFMGAFTEIQDSMQFYSYVYLTDEERDAFSKRTPDDRILDNYKKACRDKMNVALPEFIPAVYNGCRTIRNNLAHLLEIRDITGEYPHRKMTVIRYTDYTTTEHWHAQTRCEIPIEEDDLKHWTDELRDCRGLMNVIVRLAGLNEEFDFQDEQLIDISWIPWWDGRWGTPPEHSDEPTGPIGRYRAKPNPRKYWVPKDQWVKWPKASPARKAAEQPRRGHPGKF